MTTSYGTYNVTALRFVDVNEFSRRIRIIKDTFGEYDFDYLRVHELEFKKL